MFIQIPFSLDFHHPAFDPERVSFPENRLIFEKANAEEIDVFLALPDGAYRYDAIANELQFLATSDLRRITGYQDFVDDAPLDLIYVADYTRMNLVPVGQRESYASVAAGAITQNVYLFAASNGLATVIRAWIDRAAIADALGLTHDQQVLLSQTVGYPRSMT